MARSTVFSAMLRAFAFCFVVFSASASAQPLAPERDGGWVAIGAGVGSPHGTAFAASVNVGRERVVQLGLHTSGDYSATGAGPVLTAVHLGGGLSRVDRWSRFALTAGPAFVLQRQLGEADAASSVGVLASAQAIVTPIPEIGLGLDAYVHTSRLATGVGVALTVVFERNK